MLHRMLLCAAGALAALAAPASAATKLAGYAMPTGIGAYRDTVAWSAYDEATRRYALTVWEGGAPRALPVPPRKDEFDATVGRDADGRPIVVYGDCPAGGSCGVYGFDPQRNEARLLAASARRDVRPHAPSLWRSRVVWVEERARRRHTVYVARAAGGGAPKVVRRFNGREVWATALLGRELALDVGPTERLEEQIQVQRLDGARRHVVGHTSTGEGGQTFVGLSFKGASLYWTRVCQGDPCARGTAFRYRHGRYAHATVPGDLAGFAVASSGTYWVTERFGYCGVPGEGEGETCDVEQASLRFRPGRDRHDGP
jgi:hypothetical protein